MEISIDVLKSIMETMDIARQEARTIAVADKLTSQIDALRGILHVSILQIFTNALFLTIYTTLLSLTL